MRILFYLLCFFALNTLYAQRDYHFDYEVKYFFKFKSLNIDNITSYFINSKDNSYHAVKIPIDGSKYRLLFIDNDSLIAKQNFEAAELNKSAIVINSINVNLYGNPFKYQINNYDFEKKNDTILLGQQMLNIKLVSTNSKRTKRKKLGHSIYLIDPSFNFLPMLEDQTPYEIWKARANIPNGLLKYCYHYDYKNELGVSLEMKELIKRDFKISFSH